MLGREKPTSQDTFAYKPDLSRREKLAALYKVPEASLNTFYRPLTPTDPKPYHYVDQVLDIESLGIIKKETLISLALKRDADKPIKKGGWSYSENIKLVNGWGEANITTQDFDSET